MLRGMSIARTRCLIAALLVGLQACGGGGSDSGSTAAAPGASPAPAPGSPGPSPAPPAAAPAPTAGNRATCGLANFRSEAMALVNAQRASGASCGSRGRFAAAPALNWNDALAQASLVHSDDMVSANFFSHTGSTGQNPGQRIAAAGYASSTWGENIAAGQPTVASVVAGWMASDGHCANIMNPAFRDVGLACVAGNAGNSYRTYWTMALGAPR
jgi:uncharacterized protein YkwD